MKLRPVTIFFNVKCTPSSEIFKILNLTQAQFVKGASSASTISSVLIQSAFRTSQAHARPNDGGDGKHRYDGPGDPALHVLYLSHH